MSLNITNFTSRINTQSIDVNAVKDITSQIFEEKAIKTVDLDTLNLSKFKRVDLGVDLYNNKNNAEKATQVAVRNSGLDIHLNQNFMANIQYLNAQAAVSAHKSTKKAEDKVFIPVSEAANVSLKEVFAISNSAQIFESQSSSKDKKGSNPFFFQNNSDSEEASATDSLSIFA